MRTQKKLRLSLKTNPFMMGKHTSTLSIHLMPSWTLLALVVFIHLLFLSVCLLFFPFKWAALCFTVVYFFWTLYQTGWLPFNKINTQIHISSKNHILVSDIKNKNQLIEVTLLDTSVLTRFVSILHFRVEGRTNRVTLFPDAMEKGLYQKLIVYIRWQVNVSEPSNSFSSEG